MLALRRGQRRGVALRDAHERPVHRVAHRAERAVLPRALRVALAGKELVVTEAFGLPIALAPGLYVIDVGRDALAAVDFIRIVGMGFAVGALVGYCVSVIIHGRAEYRS